MPGLEELMTLLLWVFVTVTGSAAIVLCLKAARAIYRAFQNNPESSSLVRAVNKRDHSIDFLAITVSIAVSSGGESVKFAFERSNFVLSLVFIIVVLFVLIFAGSIGVWYEAKKKSSFKAKTIKRFALISSLIVLGIGICIQVLMMA
jgi:hypothetical protein